MSYGTYCRLGVHIWASNRTVIREARKKVAVHCRNNPEFRDARKEFYNELLDYHRQEQDLATEFRL